VTCCFRSSSLIPQPQVRFGPISLQGASTTTNGPSFPDQAMHKLGSFKSIMLAQRDRLILVFCRPGPGGTGKHGLSSVLQ
jgi:hypothetical protein